MVDLLQAYKVKEDAAFPSKIKDFHGLFYGFSYSIQAFIVNTKLLSRPTCQAGRTSLTRSGAARSSWPTRALGFVVRQMFQMIGLYGWDHINAVATDPAHLHPGVRPAIQPGLFAVGSPAKATCSPRRARACPSSPCTRRGRRIAQRYRIARASPTSPTPKLFMDFLTTKEGMGIIFQGPLAGEITVPTSARPGTPPQLGDQVLPVRRRGSNVKRDEFLEKFGEIFTSSEREAAPANHPEHPRSPSPSRGRTRKWRRSAALPRVPGG